MSEQHEENRGGVTTGQSTRGEEDGQSVDTIVDGTVVSTLAAERHSVDSIFDTLADPARRYVLSYLLRSDEPVALGELVDYAVGQTDAPDDDSFRQEVVVKLTHAVLPSLAEDGYIEYDIEQQVVETTDRTPVLAPYLELAQAQERLAEEIRSG